MPTPRSLLAKLNKIINQPIKIIAKYNLVNNTYPQGIKLKKVLDQLDRKLPQIEQDWIVKIEDERKRLLRLNMPLLNMPDDANFDECALPPPYDKNKTISQVCQASKNSRSGLILYLLTRILGPQNILELGTNVGISSAYMAAALKVNKSNGKVITLDASPYRQHIAKKVHCNIGVDNISYVKGLFSETLSDSLKSAKTIDLAFVDGHHQYQPTLDYFEQILQFSNSNTVFVFDDIRWSDGMRKAWAEIQSDNRSGLVVDLSSVGVCMLCQDTTDNTTYKRYVSPRLYVL